MAELIRGEQVELAEEDQIFAEEVNDIEFVTKGTASLLKLALTYYRGEGRLRLGL